MITIKQTLDVNDIRSTSWSGAVQTLDILTDEEIEQILNILEECNTEPMDRTDLNDFFWFDTDTIAEWLGYDDFETLWNERN